MRPPTCHIIYAPISKRPSVSLPYDNPFDSRTEQCMIYHEYHAIQSHTLQLPLRPTFFSIFHPSPPCITIFQFRAHGRSISTLACVGGIQLLVFSSLFIKTEMWFNAWLVCTYRGIFPFLLVLFTAPASWLGRSLCLDIQNIYISSGLFLEGTNCLQQSSSSFPCRVTHEGAAFPSLVCAFPRHLPCPKKCN